MKCEKDAPMKCVWHTLHIFIFFIFGSHFAEFRDKCVASLIFFYNGHCSKVLYLHKMIMYLQIIRAATNLTAVSGDGQFGKSGCIT